ncbi:MAG: P-II family nitrogen regulator [Desulfobacterales bacterium]|nr:MAG: P-II family nitrogen regulator [Desulfobacterales bacterium]
MKAIKAFIRSNRAPAALDALCEAGITHATLTEVLAVGAGTDSAQGEVNIELGRKVHRMVQLEVICLDKDELRAVELIRKAACTMRPGDGIITVANVNRVVKVRTGAESAEAL